MADPFVPIEDKMALGFNWRGYPMSFKKRLNLNAHATPLMTHQKGWKKMPWHHPSLLNVLEK